MSIEEMAAAARALGYAVHRLTDHSKAVTVANGLDEKRTREQIAKIRAANERKSRHPHPGRQRSGHPKGWPPGPRRRCARRTRRGGRSVHSYMNLDRAEMTDRLLAAIENPYTQIIGHPTGRLLLRRDASPTTWSASSTPRANTASPWNATPRPNAST
jgi:DNA polymerase (family 10)